MTFYRKMKTKSSQNMPADKYSLLQHILRAHYQTWIWMHVNVKIIAHVDLQENGWAKMVDEELSETMLHRYGIKVSRSTSHFVFD